jgi:hypothetical protein
MIERPIRTEDLLMRRGKAIQGFSFVEHVISRFIACSYFKPEDQDQLDCFVEEVMEEQYFSFELKHRLFIKILRGRFPKIYTSFPRKALKDMQELRNIIAHGQNVAKGRTGTSEVFDIALMHGGKQYPVDELFKKYDLLYEQVYKAVSALPGVTLTKY